MNYLAFQQLSAHITTQTAVGRRFAEAGFAPKHMGGNCLAWAKPCERDGAVVLICDTFNGLGEDTPDQDWWVVLEDEGFLYDEVASDEVSGIDEALARGDLYLRNTAELVQEAIQSTLAREDMYRNLDWNLATVERAIWGA